MYRAPETDELFSYHYIGNSEVHAIKHPAKRKSLQAIAFDGICVKAFSGRGVGALLRRRCKEASTGPKFGARVED